MQFYSPYNSTEELAPETMEKSGNSHHWVSKIHCTMSISWSYCEGDYPCSPKFLTWLLLFNLCHTELTSNLLWLWFWLLRDAVECSNSLLCFFWTRGFFSFSIRKQKCHTLSTSITWSMPSRYLLSYTEHQTFLKVKIASESHYSPECAKWNFSAESFLTVIYRCHEPQIEN